MTTDKDMALLAAALKRKEALDRDVCIDPFVLTSRPYPKQEEVLRDVTSFHIYVTAGNQTGKSQLGGRIVSWKFMENHPYWKRSPEWGREPLLIIVAGRLSSQVEELWQKKIKPFLPADCYKEERVSTALQAVHNTQNGNKILFTSHDKANVAWEKIQSYVAHHVWIDEMPSDYRYIEECHRRVDARQGQCIVTMTPKSRNDKIRHLVDNVDPRIGKKYMMSKLDNPIYKGREEIELAKLAHETEEKRNSILYGHWIGSDEGVFEFSRADHVAPLPDTYTTSWPHVVGFDPAPRGLGGFVVLANMPRTSKWYLVKATYIYGKAPSSMVREVKELLSRYNVVRKVYDSHEPWFHDEAVVHGLKGWIGADKHSRKKELIVGLQQVLLDRNLIIAPGNDELISEIIGAEWVDSDQAKIKNSTKYHLLDALQYAIDNLPNIKDNKEFLTRDQQILAQHMAEQITRQKEKEAKSVEKKTGRRQFIIGGKRRWIR